MPKVPIIMPQLGESVAEATIIRFTAQVGEPVATDQEIIEVETNKAVMGVTTPCGGVIAEFIAEVNQTYANGTVLGYIEASAEDAERLGESASETPSEIPATLETHKNVPSAMPTITIPDYHDSDDAGKKRCPLCFAASPLEGRSTRLATARPFLGTGNRQKRSGDSE
jgi:pyruvate/2-oxoglutarate dehydrogenase complex dihydrolipoamide acyltransferase (E2) component